MPFFSYSSRLVQRSIKTIEDTWSSIPSCSCIPRRRDSTHRIPRRIHPCSARRGSFLERRALGLSLRRDGRRAPPRALVGRSAELLDWSGGRLRRDRLSPRQRAHHDHHRVRSGTRVWRIHREALSNVGGAKGTAVTRLLAALARVVHARLEVPAAKPLSWSEADYCDDRHPSVIAMARRHVRATPLATACAIWSTMWAIPYRFGTWQWSASETIARGHGMCTTKAVLQVALMRALGIEAGYVTEVSGALARALMPIPTAVVPSRDVQALLRGGANRRTMDPARLFVLARPSRSSLHERRTWAPFVEWDAARRGLRQRRRHALGHRSLRHRWFTPTSPT